MQQRLCNMPVILSHSKVCCLYSVNMTADISMKCCQGGKEENSGGNPASLKTVGKKKM